MHFLATDSTFQALLSQLVTAIFHYQEPPHLTPTFTTFDQRNRVVVYRFQNSLVDLMTQLGQIRAKRTIERGQSFADT